MVKGQSLSNRLCITGVPVIHNRTEKFVMGEGFVSLIKNGERTFIVWGPEHAPGKILENYTEKQAFLANAFIIFLLR